MLNPKISIIIPAYNHGKELPRCLDSVFAQTFISPFSKDMPANSAWGLPVRRFGGRGIFEIIIVNDGSTDGTAEILENYLKTRLWGKPPLNPLLKGGETGTTQPVSNEETERCKIKIINQKNQGAPTARNNGFKESKGDYVIFLDADVVLKKDALEKMLDALEINTPLTPLYRGEKLNSFPSLRVGTCPPSWWERSLFCHPACPPIWRERSRGISFADSSASVGMTKMDFSDSLEIGYAYSDFKFGWKKFSSGQFSAKKLCQMNYIHTSALIARGAFPKTGFDPTLKKFQDWDLWLTMLENGYRGVWIPEILFSVKPRRAGMSAWLPKCMYKIPWKKFGITIKAIEKYEEWRNVVMRKHRLL